MLVAALAIPLASASVAFGSSQAWAKTKAPNGKITCSTLSNPTGTDLQILGCSDGGSADSGPGTTVFPYSALLGGGTLTWQSGKTTTFGAPTLGSGAKNTKCPGYSKKNTVAENPSAISLTGSITADTSGLKMPGSYSGLVCVSAASVISFEKPLKIK